ncbi:hypothetical protein ACFVW1_53600, partial [Streptomyces olivochromogenes]|uniref:hypothetical protein n=1 Tax=Streptomyces olivochromogenes TaxID=1963 RepID=UPI0036D88912
AGLLERDSSLTAAFLARPAWQERAVGDDDFASSLGRLSAQLPELVADADPGRLLTVLDGLRQRGATGTAGPGTSGNARTSTRPGTTPATRPQQSTPQVSSAPVGGADVAAELPPQLTDLLAGPQGEPVAVALAANPELLPLLIAAPAVADEIGEYPDRLDSYLIGPFLERVLPAVDEDVLEPDSEGERRLTGSEAFDGYFATFLESVDLALGQERYAGLKAAARHAWRAVVTDRQERWAVVREERAQRFRDFQAGNWATWHRSGRIHYAGQTGAEHFTDVQRGVLDRVARWGEGIREASGARKINMPLHAHLDGGSGGVAFFYALAPDGRVDLVVYAKSTSRADNNAYRWNNSGSYVSGPPPLEEIANDPVLLRSRGLVAGAGAGRAGGGAVVVPQPSLLAAPGAAERGAVEAARALADAVGGYWDALRAFGSKGLSPADRGAAAAGLVGAGTVLRALGADVFAQVWEQQPQRSRQVADGLYREVLAAGGSVDGAMPEGSEHERGAIALAHAAFGGSKSARAVAGALAARPAVRPELQEDERLVGELRRELEKLGWKGAPVDAPEFRQLDNDLYGDGRRPVEGARIRAMAEFKRSGVWPGLAGGGKKGKKPPRSGQGAAAEVLGQETGLPEAGSSRRVEAPSEVESVTVPAETVRAVRAAVDKLPLTWRNRVLSDTMGLLRKLPYPEDASLESLVGSVYWMLRLPAAPLRGADRPGGRGDAPTLRERLLSHPLVAYALARRGHHLGRMLEWNGVLVEVLGMAPTVLDALTAASDAWFAAQTRETADILARENVVNDLQDDPILRSSLFASDHNLLRFWGGRLDVVRHIPAIAYTVKNLADLSSEFAAAVLSLDDPVEALWRLGSESGLASALLNRVLRGFPGTSGLYQKVLGDETFKAVLRLYPEQLNVVFSSEQILDTIRAKPELLDILSRSSTLTDVLEDMPEFALRLLSDEARITAAVNNPAVAVTLSYNPSHYHTVDDDQLVLKLDGTQQPEDSMKTEGMVPGSWAPLSKGEIDEATVPELLNHLKELNQTFANRDLVRSLLPREDLVRFLARELPHALRRVRPGHTAILNLPDDGVLVTMLLTAGRHQLVASLFSVPKKLEEGWLLASLVKHAPKLGSLLHRSPALAATAFYSIRTLQLLPADLLAENPWLPPAVAQAPPLFKKILGAANSDTLTTLTAEDSALLRLIYRHSSILSDLTDQQWQRVLDNVKSAPRLLNLLTDSYGATSAAHWTYFLTGELFPVLAQQLHVAVGTPEPVLPAVEGDTARSADDDGVDAWAGRPTALALITFPELSREAIARPGFVETWQKRPAEFDRLAKTALVAHRASNQEKSPAGAVNDHLVGLLDAVKAAAADSIITEEGYELYPELAESLSLLLDALRAGDTPQQLSDRTEAKGLTANYQQLNIYATLRQSDRLREAVLRNRYLAQGVFFVPGFSELMTTRPSLLDQFNRSPELLRQIVRVEGLPELLANDDRSYAVFNMHPKMRANFVSHWVSVALENSEYTTAWARRSSELVRTEYNLVNTAVAESPSVAKAVAEREQTARTLVTSPELLNKLREADEDVVRAVMATQGRLEASVARPELVTMLGEAPALAVALGDRPEVAASAVSWQRLVGNEPLLHQFAEHVELIDTVLGQPRLLAVVIAAPAFVGVLAGTADGARERLTREEMLQLVLRNPDLAADLVADTGLRAALTGLPGLAELLTYRSDVLDALRKRPDLVGALHQNR